MSIFKNKNVVISGGSRGIGLSIAKNLAMNGANIAILAKTDVPHPKLPGTIFTASKEISSQILKLLFKTSSFVKGFTLSDVEMTDVISFLKSLTDITFIKNQNYGIPKEFSATP